MKTQNATGDQQVGPAHRSLGEVGSTLPQGWAVPFSECGFDFRLHHQNRDFDQHRVLAFIKRRIPKVWPLAEVVGGWVWLAYPYSTTDQACSHLFELGFHFSERRQLWQHPCGQFGRTQSRSQRPPLRYFPAQVEAST